MRRGVLPTVVVWALGFGVLRVSLLAPEACPPLAPGAARRAADAAGAWLEAGQGSDGRYLYEFDRRSDRAVPGYNIVRHAGVTMSLYQLAAAGAPEALAVADRGLEPMLDGLVPAGEGRALAEPGSSSARLGASALMAAALLDRREATADRRYDDELRDLGRFMAGQLRPDGSMLAAYDLVGNTSVEETSRYATGEAGWALARMDTAFPGEGWDRPARQVAGYLSTARDEAEGLDYRPWPDQWAAYLLAELAPEGLTEHQAAYARRLAARFGMLVRVESQKDGWPTPFVDAHARAAGLGVWVEGLGSLVRVAASDRRLADLRPALEARLACGAGLLIARQVDSGSATEVGAWFRAGSTRMDDQQHALSGLLAADALVGGAEP